MSSWLRQGDCVAGMRSVAEFIPLVICDPPYNIGYDYDGEYADNMTPDDYREFSRQWMLQVFRVLQPGGSFWLVIGDEWAADLQIVAREIGFHRRSTVVWYYTFGVNQDRNFSRSHTQLLYFTKGKTGFTFNADDPACRVPSARQLIYNDKRANPKGRLPDNTWILRPQDVPEAFLSTETCWHIPRVAGTFKERRSGAPTQIPEALVGRIIRLCSNPGDTVLDPMAGMGTVPSVAKKLGRRYIAFEQSQKFVQAATERLASVKAGDPLEGAVPQGG